MRLSILIIEDHDALREITNTFLSDLGHEVRGVPDAESMDAVLAHWTPDIAILDVNLPGEDCHSVCNRLRATLPNLGIVMLTARAAVADRIAGYGVGADVYLAKPTSNEELGAAVSSLGRRVRTVESSATLVLDDARRELVGPRGMVALSESDRVVLRAMSLAPGRQVEHWQLLDLLGLEANAEGKATLEVRLVRLRKKLVEAGVPEAALQSIRGVGYRLQALLNIR